MFRPLFLLFGAKPGWGLKVPTLLLWVFAPSEFPRIPFSGNSLSCIKRGGFEE